MNSQGLLLMVQALLALLLMWTCFCRLVKTDQNTDREVRWVILFEGMAGGLVFMGPWLPLLMPREMHWTPGATPAGIWLVLLLAVTLVQLVTAKFWKDGRVPEPFQKVPARTGMIAAVAMMLVSLFALHAPPATAQAPASGWREIEGDVVYLPPGSELKCGNSKGCIAFTVDSLSGLLDEAGGSCGHIPPMAPAPKTGRGV